MAAVKPSLETNDSRSIRESDEGSTAAKFTAVNGNRNVLSPAQHTSFRSSSIVYTEPPRQNDLQRPTTSQERKHKPLFVDSDGFETYRDESTAFNSQENHVNRLVKRKRSTDTLTKLPSNFVSPHRRQEDIFKPVVQRQSPARSLPPILQYQEGDPKHTAESISGWNQRPISSHHDVQSTDSTRRDSHTHHFATDQRDRSDSPQLEADAHSDQDSEPQHDSTSLRKGPAQRRRFSQRSKTGCHTCRRRKKKCDEGKPQCQNCTRGDFICEGYGPKNKLDAKMQSKPVALQARSDEGHRFSDHPQPIQSVPTEQWIDTHRDFPHENRIQPLSDNAHYARLNGARLYEPVEHEPPYSSDRFDRAPLSESSARTSLQSARFGAMSAPSLQTDSHGGTMSHSSLSGSSNGLGSAFDTPRAALATRLGLNLGLPAYPSPNTTEKEYMLSGQAYRHYTDPLLLNERQRCRKALQRFNAAAEFPEEFDMDERIRRFRRIFRPEDLERLAESHNHPIGTIGDQVVVEAPFHCEYGYNINLGDNVAIEAGCSMYDPCTITVGRRTTIGPRVCFYGRGRTLDTRERNGSQGKFRGGRIIIEEDCYIGGDVKIMPNVTIGRGSVVEVGTVVDKSIAAGSMVVAGPMRMVVDEHSIPPRADPLMSDSLWPSRFDHRSGRMSMRE